MSVYLKNFGCPDKFTSEWKKLHVTKWILLCAGMAMALSGYYIGSSLIVFGGGHQMWILCALFWGSAGVCIVAYSIALVPLKKKFCEVLRSLKYEENPNSASNFNFYKKCNGMCTQMDKQMSILMPARCCGHKSFNKAVPFKGKYSDCNGSANGMTGSLKTVYKSETLYAHNNLEKKISNNVLESLSFKKQSDIFCQYPRSLNVVSGETLVNQKISSSLEKFAKLEDHTAGLQNEFESNDIFNNIPFVFKQETKKYINKNNFHVFDKYTKIENYFQLPPSFFKHESFEDPYFCKTLFGDEKMELDAGSLVTRRKYKTSEGETFASDIASSASILLANYLISGKEHSYEKFLNSKDNKMVTGEAKYSEKQFWSKFPMKRSNSKLTKKRCEPIFIKNNEIVSKDKLGTPNYEESSLDVIENSGKDSTLLLTDRKIYRTSEIDLSALTFMDERSTILVNDIFHQEPFAESEMNFRLWYAV